MKRFLIIVFCAGLIGCAHVQYKQDQPFVEPQYGMTKTQMMDLIGAPDSIEIYKKADLSREEVYNYIRRYHSSQEKVPICLINNRIVGWGKAYYEDHISQDDTRIK